MTEEAEQPETQDVSTCDPKQQDPDQKHERQEQGDPSVDGRASDTSSSSSRNRILVSGENEEETLDLNAPEYYLNREFSLLEFQRRVLHEAKNENRPLLHRVEFLAHFTRNMDEFFMKRIGGLKQQMAANVTELTPDGRNPRDQWTECIDRSRTLFRELVDTYQNMIRPALEDEDIRILEYEQLGEEEERRIRSYFESCILPVLTPLTFDPAHPFPFISNLSLSLAVVTRRKQEESLRFSRVKIPGNRSRLVEVEGRDGSCFVRLEEIVESNLDMIFPYVNILDASLFRVTRNAEVRRNEEVAEDLMEMIEKRLRERRFASVVRLDVERNMHEFALDTLKEQLDLEDDEVFRMNGPLDYTDFDRLTEVDRPDLSNPSWTPQPHPRLLNDEEDGEKTNLFAEIRKKDLLLHHPYQSFSRTVQTFLDQAARDPKVLAIKLAIYRTAPDSEVISTIIDAANNGKQVAVMVELKARFDEENNLRWVERLEEEGIHVAYGTIGFKTHTKTAIAVREEEDTTRIYSHVASGNYHSETAKVYEDVGLLTVDRDIGHDVSRVFHYFTGQSYPEDYRKLLVAPGNMRERFVELIRREAKHAEQGKPARIILKANRLEDPDIVKELYRSSIAGVEIDLIIRDICRIRPGLKNISENIHVRSIVGRFLEHSRIYYFENDGNATYLIGSADLMTRNLDRRVEAITPVDDRDLQESLDFILETLLADNTLSWSMQSDGSYIKNTPDSDEPVINAQKRFMEKASNTVERVNSNETN